MRDILGHVGRRLRDELAVMGLPAKYRRRLRSTNMQERLIQELRRRERVIRIFPNEDSALRLFAAMLAETHEAWLSRKHLDMDEFYDWLGTRRQSKGELVTMSHHEMNNINPAESYSTF